jgi:hypothetical protein
MAQDIVNFVRAMKADDTSLKIFQEMRSKTRNPEL